MASDDCELSAILCKLKLSRVKQKQRAITPVE